MSTGFKIDTGFATDTREGRLLSPGSATSLGYNWMDPITDQNRADAILREPVAHRVVITVAQDVFDNWFNLKPTQKPQKETEDFDQKIQMIMSKLRLKAELKRMAAFERGFGWAMMAADYLDEGDSAADPLLNPTDILRLKAYAPTQISSITKDRQPLITSDSIAWNPTLKVGDINPNFNMPLHYFLRQPSTTTRLKVHYTRTFHWATRQISEELEAWQGTSVLDPIWDDLTTIRNIAWAIGETMFRYAAPFADLTFTDAEKPQIQEWINSGVLDNLYMKKFFAHNQNQILDFKGIEGKALNPTYYYLPPMERISIGTGIPLAILRGIQVGAVTGSETDIKNYFDFVVSIAQTNYEDGIREIINKIRDVKKAEVSLEGDFKIEWNAPYELSEAQKATIDVQKMQVIQLRQPFFTRNELRKKIDPNAIDLTPEQGGDEIVGRTGAFTTPTPPGTAQFNVKDEADGSRTITEIPRRRSSTQ